MGLPISSLLVAADAVSISSDRPSSAIICWNTYSAIGLLQMLPWHINSTFFMDVYLLMGCVFW